MLALQAEHRTSDTWQKKVGNAAAVECVPTHGTLSIAALKQKHAGLCADVRKLFFFLLLLVFLFQVHNGGTLVQR